MYAIRKEGEQEVQVEPSSLQVGDVIVIKPGERVPVDAVITSGITAMDTKALTGETVPQTVGTGDRIYSGSINTTGVVEAEVKKLYKDSTVSRVMELVENAQKRKARYGRVFVQRFTKFYNAGGNSSGHIDHGSSACVFTRSPVEYLDLPRYDRADRRLSGGTDPVGSGSFSRRDCSGGPSGIVVKGGNYLEMLAKADTFVFDKTGTLTEGVFEVLEVYAESLTESELLEITAHVENYSNHPIAQSLMKLRRRI